MGKRFTYMAVGKTFHIFDEESTIRPIMVLNQLNIVEDVIEMLEDLYMDENEPVGN